jgi:hypothetical protein
MNQHSVPYKFLEIGTKDFNFVALLAALPSSMQRIS